MSGRAPLDFAAQAARLRAQAARVRQVAEKDARKLEAAAAHLEAFPDVSPAALLRKTIRSVTVTGVEHLHASKVRIARGREASPKVRELHDREMTLRELHGQLEAAGFRISGAQLSRIFSGMHPCPDELRKPIETLTARPAAAPPLPGIVFA